MQLVQNSHSSSRPRQGDSSIILVIQDINKNQHKMQYFYFINIYIPKQLQLIYLPTFYKDTNLLSSIFGRQFICSLQGHILRLSLCYLWLGVYIFTNLYRARIIANINIQQSYSKYQIKLYLQYLQYFNSPMSEKSNQITPILVIILTIIIPCLLKSSDEQSSINQKWLTTTRPNLKINKNQILHLSISSPTKIQLRNTPIDQISDSKLHSLSFNSHRTNIQVDDGSLDHSKILKDFHVSVGTVSGEISFYLSLINGFHANIIKDYENIRRSELQQNLNNQNLQILQGDNYISIKKIQQYFNQKRITANLLSTKFCIIAIPKISSKFVIKFGNPEYLVSPIPMKQLTQIKVWRSSLSYKVYKLMINQPDFVVKFEKIRGFPILKLVQCKVHNTKCFQQSHQVPEIKSSIQEYPNKKQQKQIIIQQHIIFQVTDMLSKTQQYSGQKLQEYDLYLIVDAKYQSQAQVQVIIYPSDYTMKLKENQIIKEDLTVNSYKKYQIKLKQQNKVRVTIEVFEGFLSIQVRQFEGDWFFSPTQTNGVISFQIPDIAKRYIVQVKAMHKDATYTVFYSSGQYQIIVEDGYPTSHVINPKQSIKLFYNNQKLRPNPIYLSFSLKNHQVLNSLSVKIFYFIQKQQEKIRKQYLPSRPLSQITNLAKSVVMQVPGNYSKLELVFFNELSEPISISVTINDQQIIFLPLGYNLPLQVQKDGLISVLVDNNQQGHIQLILKKCDESLPKISYSLSSSDFINGIYDYESMQENQRIFKSNIKVSKGGGLYIRIFGDQISNSFIQITANYLKKDQRKQNKQKLAKKGNYGEINYQLITNSKAQVWFKQLQCQQQCQRSAKYQFYWSTSKSDLFRHMICPGSFVYKNSSTQKIRTQNYQIQSKPGRDGIIAFKHILDNPIIYISIKATTQNTTEIIYQDLQIINIAGQMSKVSTQFLVLSGFVTTLIIVLFVWIIKKQTNKGYLPLNSKINKTKKQKQGTQQTKVV